MILMLLNILRTISANVSSLNLAGSAFNDQFADYSLLASDSGSMADAVTVRASHGRGRGLFACKAFSAGEVVFVEHPFVALPSSSYDAAGLEIGRAVYADAGRAALYVFIIFCSNFFFRALTFQTLANFWQTLRGSFSAVSKPNFARKYSFESS